MATIVVMDGPAKGQKFALAGCRVAMLGRDAGCSFQIIDPKLSRFHLQIRHAENSDQHFAIDFQSKNGVFLNGKKLEKETVLMDSDVIVIGDTTLVYTHDDAVDAKKAADAWKKSGQGHLRTVSGD